MTDSPTHAPEGPGRPAGPVRRTLKLVRSALSSVFALLYLALCVGLLVWAAVVSSGESADASFAGVVPLLATAPVSVVVLMLWDHAAMLLIGFGLGALVNAFVIGWCARALGRGLNRVRGEGGPGPVA